MNESGGVTIRLTQNEALVLFEWLARLDDIETLPVEDPAEEFVLSKVHGQLEKTLAEPFRPDYRELVDAARKAIRDGA